MSTSFELVKQLRQQTGLGLNQVVEALNASGGDIEKAKLWLRTHAKAKVEDATDPSAEGRVSTYVHHNSNLGAMVHLSCKTDFTARSAEFIKLSDDIAMHVAAAKPKWVSVSDIPLEVTLHEEKAMFQRTVAENVPEARRSKVVEGRMKAFHSETVLLEQPFVKDPKTTVGQMIAALSAKVGEPITVKAMARFQVGAL